MKAMKWSFGLVGVVALLVAGLALAQEQGGGGRGGRGGGADGRQRNPEQMREQMRARELDRIRSALEATDEEWATLKPGIENVLTLSGQQMRGRMRQMMRMNPRNAEPAAAEMSEVEKATADLEAVLANEEATPEEITAKLTALREAQAKAAKELADARTVVKATVTPRQEAKLVLQGILD